jgi:leader peptidase (prepilin peptidase)/N-methyltransferase
MHVGAALLAGLVLAAVNLIYATFRGRQALGMGDMKLIAAGTLWVGPSGVLSMLLWSSVTGLLHFLAKSVLGAELSAGSRIPFGPHLALGIWLVWLFGPVML